MNEDERGILEMYETKLERAQAEVSELELVVQALRRRNQSYERTAGTPRLYRGRESLPGFLVNLLGDGHPRGLDEIQAAVIEHYPKGEAPKRNTISTRLNELVHAGRFGKTSSGDYWIAS